MTTAEKVEAIHVELEQLHPHPDNWRGKLDKAGLAELAESLKQRQDLPCIVRPQPGGKQGQYQLLDGHRRHAAAKLAKLPLLRCEVHDVDDLTALEIIGRSHIQRAGVSALEEAAGLEALVKAGWDGATMAAELGKSATWVARRMSLLALAPDIRKAAAEGGKVKNVPMPWGNNHRQAVGGLDEWPARSLELLASAPPETQMLLLGRLSRGHAIPQPGDVQAALADLLHVLSAAAFDKSDPTLNPKQGACTTCDARASCRRSLFDDAPEAEDGKIPRNDRCLNPACFEIKSIEHAKRLVAEAKKEHGAAVVVVAESGAARKAFPKAESWTPYGLAKAKKDDKGAQFYFDVGKGKGEWLAPVKRGGGSRRIGSSKPTPLKARREQYAKRRLAHVITAIKAAAEKMTEWPSGSPFAYENAGWAALAFGTDHAASDPAGKTIISQWAPRSRAEKALSNLGDPWEVFEAYTHDSFATDETPGAAGANAHGFRQVAPVLLGRLHFRIAGDIDLKIHARESAKICEALCLNYAELTQAALNEIPDPKGWAKLNADGTPKSKPLAKSAKDAKKAKAVGAQRAASPANVGPPDILAGGAELQEDGSVKIKKGKGKRRPKARAGGK